MKRILGLPPFLQIIAVVVALGYYAFRTFERWQEHPAIGVHVGALGAYGVAVQRHHAVFGGDAVIWIPIVLQVLSFIQQLLQSRRKEADKPGNGKPIRPN